MADELKFEPELFLEDIPKTVEKEPRTRTNPKAKTTSIPPYKDGMFVEPLTMAYGFFGMGVGTLEVTRLGKEHMPIGSAIVESAESCAKAWDKAAKTSPAIRRMLNSLVSKSNLMTVTIAHVPIAVAIANEIPATQRLVKGFQSYLERMTHNGQSNEPTPDYTS